MSENNQNLDICQCNIIHADKVQIGKKKGINQKTAEDLAGFYKLFSESTRIKILQLLSLSEMCVCDISTVLDITQSAISHQLKTLRQARLVKHRRSGKVMYYSLDDHHVTDIIQKGLEHIRHE